MPLVVDIAGRCSQLVSIISSRPLIIIVASSLHIGRQCAGRCCSLVSICTDLSGQGNPQMTTAQKSVGIYAHTYTHDKLVCNSRTGIIGKCLQVRMSVHAH